MKLSIEEILVDPQDRVRLDPGDLESLSASISEVGLLNPVVVDENNRLVAGYRRLSACRSLGWDRVEVRVIAFSGDELKMLEAEAAENLFRKDFTPEEIARIELRRQEILRKLRGNVFQRFWRWLRRLWLAVFSAREPRREEDAA